MNKVNAFCKKEDFWKSKETGNGRIIVRFNETEKNETVEYSEAVVDNTPEAVRKLVLEAITEHDSSNAVNGFIIGGVELWLDRNTRAALMRRFEAEKANNVENTTLWYGEGKFEMPVGTAIEMLNKIEIYACKSFDVTAAHKAAVAKLASVEELLAYDYRAGYPDKLTFEL